MVRMKTPLEIAMAIERHGEGVRMASKFHGIMMAEIFKAGYIEPTAVHEVKQKVSEIMRERRLAELQMETA
ncbi:MAG: hypothetical protein A3H52_00850 [Candidatus Zambryskibacteria bacterium RIFCSPLOWO2_02_FULL_39_26]|nr:MAG: hypothetical protein A3H52_00850 [Candidatus Zambryskibacteria bacterium RIFCSPLOWO2_02_FULL_39_26]